MNPLNLILPGIGVYGGFWNIRKVNRIRPLPQLEIPHNVGLNWARTLAARIYLEQGQNKKALELTRLNN